MSEKNMKPTIEEIVSEFLEGERLKNFLDLNKFLKDNQLTVTKPSPSTKILRRSWTVKYKGKKICAFKIWSKNNWFFGINTYKNFTDAETFEKYITAEQKKFLLDNIRTTPPCCKGHDNIEFFGKIFNTVCTCWPHFQNNPEGEALAYAKQFILVNKRVIADISETEKATK